MALPLILVGQVARSILVGGTKHAVKKYGDDVVKQVQKSKEFKNLKKQEIDLKNKRVADSKTPKKEFPEYKQSASEKALNRPSQMRAKETQKVNDRNKRLERERMDRDYFDIDGDPLDEVPLRFDMKTGGLLSDDRAMYKDGGGPGIEALRKEAPEVVEAMGYNEGGSVDNQMLMVMTPPMESEMESDDDMEDGYTRFIMEEALSEEEEDMLTSKLEQDEELSMLFDKIIDVAQEFAGSGPVEGPGSGVSDSIPARLSDGEFVFTAKAVEEIGEDTLMSMMKEAEAAADKRQGFAEGELVEEETVTMPVERQPVEQNIRVTKETVGPQAGMLEQDDLVDSEVKKSMFRQNRFL